MTSYFFLLETFSKDLFQNLGAILSTVVQKYNRGIRMDTELQRLYRPKSATQQF